MIQLQLPCTDTLQTTLLVTETQLAVKNVQEEAKLVRTRFKDYLAASEGAGEPG